MLSVVVTYAVVMLQFQVEKYKRLKVIEDVENDTIFLSDQNSTLLFFNST